ncbi:MAG: aminoacyl-tRNA hydrolase [Flavobacteriales bacterium]
MKYLIVGLGNPGSEYAETRHNIGFKVVDELASELGAGFTLDKAAFRAEAKFKGRQLIFIKPITYMNLSGKAVNYWLQSEKIPLSNLLVITDDIALPFGTIRMKAKGSDGGHNGLKDIQAVLKTQEYARLRFGVGSDFAKGRQADYVLGEWKTEEKKALPERLVTAASAAKSFVFDGLAMAMTNWNNK